MPTRPKVTGVTSHQFALSADNLRMGMRMRIVLCILCLLSAAYAGSGIYGNAETSVPTVRVTSAEVHVPLVAFDARTHARAMVSASQLEVTDEGESAPVVSVESLHNSPISLLVLSDVSDSMQPALDLERYASQVVATKMQLPDDHMQAINFGSAIEARATNRVRGMTSLYDSILQALPSVPVNQGTRGVLLVLTDGDDNYSWHSLSEVIEAAQRNDIAIFAITPHPSRKLSYEPDVLEKLCGDTGGRFFEVRNAKAMEKALDEMIDELRNGYDLILRPGDGTGVHHLRVQTQEAGLQVYYRAAYFEAETPAAGAP